MSKFTLNSNVSFFSKVLFIVFTSLFILTGCGGSDSSSDDDYNTYDYTVTFIDYNGDRVGPIQKVNRGESVTIPQLQNRPNYTFTHWQEEGGDETISKTDTSYYPTKSITFEAKYSPIIYNIIFLDDNEDEIANIEAIIGETIPLPTPPDKTGYTFTSWIEVGGTETIPSNTGRYTVKRSVTFKARYDINSYTVIFLHENNTEISNHTVTYGSVIEVPNGPDKIGHAFTQWKEVGGTETIDNNTNTYTVARSVNFKPEYIEAIIEVRTQADLDNIRNYLSGNYTLMNDIVLDENGAGFDVDGWIPIGNNTDLFTGALDGNGHKITGLWIDRISTDGVGLFGWTQGITIKNLGVEIDGKGIKGRGSVGGIIGITSGDGGIIGATSGNSSITNSYVTGSVSGSVGWVGGIVGAIASGGSITNSYSAVNVSGGTNAGGITGSAISIIITNSYSTGNISGTQHVGSIVGQIGGNGTTANNAAISHSVIGTNNVNRIAGYIYSPTPTASNNFALDTMTVTGPTDGYAGTDKTATELRTQSTYSDPINGDGLGGLGWKFGNDEDNPWKIDPTKNDGLPYLYWENR
jgi:uncharacterized repeat protein (TIGR02543 family)